MKRQPETRLKAGYLEMDSRSRLKTTWALGQYLHPTELKQVSPAAVNFDWFAISQLPATIFQFLPLFSLWRYSLKVALVARDLEPRSPCLDLGQRQRRGSRFHADAREAWCCTKRNALTSIQTALITMKSMRFQKPVLFWIFHHPSTYFFLSLPPTYNLVVRTQGFLFLAFKMADGLKNKLTKLNPINRAKTHLGLSGMVTVTMIQTHWMVLT